jgi:hypothetical protein
MPVPRLGAAMMDREAEGEADRPGGRRRPPSEVRERDVLRELRELNGRPSAARDEAAQPAVEQAPENADRTRKNHG